MTDRSSYPKYSTYEHLGKRPSVLDQHYPRASKLEAGLYYPENERLAAYLNSEEELRRFGAANFCEFLEGTIEVEHCLVIPAIASLRRIPFDIPPKPKLDLYKTATDEGHHAEQSLQFLQDVRSEFSLPVDIPQRIPLFLQRLERERQQEPNATYRDLILVLNGIVTETRISKELSRFAEDTQLALSVRDLCKTHAADEAVHGSQFRALGRWLWSAFDEDAKEAAARFLTASTIARSLPDIESIAAMLHQATSRTLDECRTILHREYDDRALIDEMLFAATPTIAYLKTLGVSEYCSIDDEIRKEQQRISDHLASYRDSRLK